MSKYLKKLLTKQDLNKLADQTGISKMKLSSFADGLKRPTSNEAKKLSTALKIDPIEFMGKLLDEAPAPEVTKKEGEVKKEGLVKKAVKQIAGTVGSKSPAFPARRTPVRHSDVL